MRPAAASPRRRSRLVRALTWLLAVALLLVLGGLAGVGWYYADEILLVAEPAEPEFDLDVVDVSGGTVTLTHGEDADLVGTYGLAWSDGYARVDQIVDQGDEGVTREVTAFPDAPPEGARVRIDGYAASDDVTDAGEVFDFELSEVAVAGPLGDYPAYFVPGERETWVVFVHGRGASRAEAFRLLPAVVERGNPALVVTYRNDEGAPPDPDGEYGLGWTEAADVAAGVDYAISEGASDVVLVGYSMGGAIVGNYVRSAPPEVVRGVVYDAPVLAWGEALRFAAIDRGVPTWLTPIAQVVATARAGIRFDLLNQVDRAEELTAPILLFHGTTDASVPVATSDALAEARPDLVTYERLDDVAHVRAWNHDPGGYTEAVEAFLEEIGA